MSVPQNRFMFLEDESAAPKVQKPQAAKPQKVQKPKGIVYMIPFLLCFIC